MQLSFVPVWVATPQIYGGFDDQLLFVVCALYSIPFKVYSWPTNPQCKLLLVTPQLFLGM